MPSRSSNCPPRHRPATAHGALVLHLPRAQSPADRCRVSKCVRTVGICFMTPSSTLGCGTGVLRQVLGCYLVRGLGARQQLLAHTVSLPRLCPTQKRLRGRRDLGAGFVGSERRCFLRSGRGVAAEGCYTALRRALRTGLSAAEQGRWLNTRRRNARSRTPGCMQIERGRKQKERAGKLGRLLSK